MKDIQEIEFQAFHSLLHLAEPLYIVEPSKIMNFELFKLKNCVSKTQNLKLKFNVQNLDICMQLILKLSILDTCMHWKHTCVYRNMQVLAFSHKPRPLSSSQDHPRRNFPRTTGPSQLQKLNQFKPVLASGKNLKNLKFPPFHTNFTHFYFEFLKDFHIFRIHGPSGSLWYPRI